MKRFVLRGLLGGLIALACCAVPASAFAQITGRITGSVTDQNGTPLKGIKITAKSPTQIGGARTVYSNDEGSFTIVNLMPGEFEVTASSQGLKTFTQRGIKVGVNSPEEIYPIMEVETQTEEVTVVQQAPVVNTQTANIVEKFDADFLDKLPVPSRSSHEDILQNLPGVTGQRVRGGNTNQNQFLLEGFTTNGGNGGRGMIVTGHTLAAYEIQTGAYGAENANAAGSVMNMVTKSGSNKWEIDVRGEHQDSALRLFTDELDGRLRSWDSKASLNVGGPIVKDRVWFYTTFEFRDTVTSRGKDPTGLRPDPPRGSNISFRSITKVTWQLTQRNKLQLVFNGNRDFFKNGQGGFDVDRDAQWKMDNLDLMTGLIWDAVLADNVIFRSQVGVMRQQQDFGPELCRTDPQNCDHINPLRQNLPTLYNYNNWNTHNFTTYQSLEFKNSLEWFAESKALGSHSVKLTARYFGNTNELKTTTPGDFIIVYNGLTPFQKRELFVNDPFTQSPQYGWKLSSSSSRLLQFSLQDSFKLPNYRYLTITPGAGLLIGHAEDGTGKAILDYATATPNVSAAWDATQDGRTVVRASFNQYVDPGNLAVANFLNSSRVLRACNWDPVLNTFSSNCFFEGGGTGRTVGQPCGSDRLNPDGSPCNASLKVPRTWEYTAGAEREIVQGVALGGDFVYRRYENPFEEIETNRIWNASGTALSPTGQYRNGRNQVVTDLETPSDAFRRYIGFTSSVHKREGKLKITASYTWSRLQGNVSDGSNNPFGNNPGQNAYLYGYLPGDSRHSIKTQAVWQIHPVFSTGVVYSYTSGSIYQRRFRNDVTGDYTDLRARTGYDPGLQLNDPSDDRELRLPDIQALNLQFSLNVGQLVKSRMNMELTADVLNVLALRTATSVVENEGLTFGQWSGRQGATQMRVGFRFRY